MRAEIHHHFGGGSHMKLVGDLKEKVEKTETKEEAKKVIDKLL